jgi:hypothetical protein
MHIFNSICCKNEIETFLQEYGFIAGMHVNLA